jgi:hypothetical protein
MNNEQLAAYVISWERRSSHGAVLYSGARRVLAGNAQEAKERALRDLADELRMSPDTIDIVDVRRL